MIVNIKNIIPTRTDIATIKSIESIKSITMKMDITTCDLMSASSALIRPAIEETASKHSSWKKALKCQVNPRTLLFPSLC